VTGYSQHPDWATALNDMLRGRLRARLGADADLWRTFSLLLENPTHASTIDELITVAAAMNAPAGR